MDGVVVVVLTDANGTQVKYNRRIVATSQDCFMSEEATITT